MSSLSTRLTMLAEMLSDFAGSPLVNLQFQTLGESTPALIPCDWLALCVTDGDSYRVHPLFDPTGIRLPIRPWDTGSGLVGSAITQSAAISSALQGAAEGPGPEAHLVEAGMRELLVAPLASETGNVGAICLARSETPAFDDDDLQLAQLLASGLSSALGSARLLQETSDRHDLLETVLASSRDGMLVISTAGQILLANPAAGRLLDHAHDDLVGTPITEHPATAKLADALNRVGDGMVAELSLPRGLTVHMSRRAVTSEYGEHIGHAVMLHDISLLKDLEHLRSELIRSLSHDLRGPLSTLDLAAGMLSGTDALESKHQMACAQMVNAIDYMEKLINDLSELRRIESGGAQEIAHGDLATVVDEVVTMLQSKAEEQSQSLSCEHDRSLPITGDITQIKRMLFNLIGNALKYTPQGGQVSVSARQAEGRAVLCIEDDGIGIPDEALPRLFDRSFRVDNPETRSRPGSGLGLTIVKQIVDAHSGTIEVDSHAGSGSRFLVTLPMSPS